MRKGKNTFYDSLPPKSSDKIIHIKIKSSDLKIRNLLHFEIQRNTRMQVVGCLKYKKPRYKNKIYEDY